ncbi:putative asparagine synthase [Magnetofaba australis IT-1]|uniref:asparagine synthase (glutamine-hydrolyzing) n=2 Tax=Magnetofaba TaxID=1472292 RepID=A0A1Y2K1U3_9PROT|nr:putative asparagine synthase [Magnetofaba australis IT-1]
MALGHARLAIQDPTAAGAQPMGDAGQGLWLVCNGEIYNSPALRRELEALGRRFVSRSDNEVILHAYAQWGRACLPRLTGMFAFALWDETRQRLWLARDRMGMKPLFLYQGDGVLAFGSEIKALLAHPEVPRALDQTSLGHFLGLNYVIAPRTLFADIRQLPPGHEMSVAADGRVATRAYWDLAFASRPRLRPAQWRARWQETLAEVMADHQLADKPVGLLLSGGLDSSAVAWWMAQTRADPIQSYHFRPMQSGFDESRHARLVARDLGLALREVQLAQPLTTLLPRLAHHAEEPTADGSMVGVYALAQRAKRDVDVVLCGDGADELLAGYPTYVAARLLPLYARLPHSARRRLAKWAAQPGPPAAGKLPWREKLARFAYAAAMPPERAHAHWRIICNRELRQTLLAADAREARRVSVGDAYAACFAQCDDAHPLNRQLYVDQRLYLANDMLVKLDRMSMAHGLEARVPFVDHRLAELAAHTPPALKLSPALQGKTILRQVMRGRLPKPILTRPKEGFGMPLGTWLREDLREMTGDLLAPSRLRAMAVWDEQAVTALLNAHLRGEIDAAYPLWSLLFFALWHQQWMTA